MNGYIACFFIKTINGIRVLQNLSNVGFLPTYGRMNRFKIIFRLRIGWERKSGYCCYWSARFGSWYTCWCWSCCGWFIGGGRPSVAAAGRCSTLVVGGTVVSRGETSSFGGAAATGFLLDPPPIVVMIKERQVGEKENCPRQTSM